MLRRAVCFLMPLTLVAGCHRHHGSMEMPQMPAKPGPFPEMKMLEPMVGTWAGSGEMIEPSPDEMKAMMPESERDKFKSSFAGGGKNQMILGGASLLSEGWFEMPGDQKGNFFEVWSWDPREGKFRTSFTSDMNETGTSWVTPSGDGKCFKVKGTGQDAMGNKKKFEGCMCIVDNDTMEWEFTEKGPMGRFTMRGTSNRQK